MSPSTLVPLQSSFDDGLRDREHVDQRFREDDVLIGPVARVAERTLLSSCFEVTDLLIGFGQLVISTNDRGGSGHDVAEFLMNQIGVFRASRSAEKEIMSLLMLFDGSLKKRTWKFRRGLLMTAQQVPDTGCHEQP